jgi:hypothetical protein
VENFLILPFSGSQLDFMSCSPVQDYAKMDGLEYICPHCSLTNYKKPPPQKVANGFANASVSRNG